MREYIEKDALYSKLYDTPCDMVEIMELVENFPAADVVPVRYGKWERESIIGDDGVVVAECIACSECEYQLDYFGDVGASDYCPNCGAKMEEIK